MHVRLVRGGQTYAAFDALAPPIRSFSNPAPTGSGTVSGSIGGGNASCSVVSSQFQQASAVATPPAGVGFPHGVVGFTTNDCGAGATLTVTLTFPQALPAGTQFYKYGPPSTGAANQWYLHPATLSGNTITYTLTDNGAGDSDPRSGFISDPGGPGVVGVSSVPTLGQWALALLAGLLGLLGMARAKSRT